MRRFHYDHNHHRRPESTRQLASSAYRLAKSLSADVRPEVKVFELTNENLSTTSSTMTPVTINQIPLYDGPTGPPVPDPNSTRESNQVKIIGMDIKWSELTNELHGAFRLVIFWDDSNVIQESHNDPTSATANQSLWDVRTKPWNGSSFLAGANKPALLQSNYEQRHNVHILYDKLIEWNAKTRDNDTGQAPNFEEYFTHRKHIQINKFTTFQDPTSNQIATGALRMAWISTRSAAVATDFSYSVRVYFTDV